MLNLNGCCHYNLTNNNGALHYHMVEALHSNLTLQESLTMSATSGLLMWRGSNILMSMAGIVVISIPPSLHAVVTPTPI